MGWSVEVLRKSAKADMWDIEQCINIFMRLGYNRCVLSDDVYSYMLSVNKPMEEDIPWTLEDVANSTIVDFYLVYREEELVYYPKEKRNYHTYMFFRKINGREQMYLDFLHEYFKLFLEDIFWNCDKYFYTKEDIEKLYARKERDPNWLYYTDPKTL